ncbi:replicative helicase loader/inhibitor [Papillibacter cinnamivorans]|uniref:Loader and inhibitor of phage G40P n=1 Tax=Papillibacter cinnamivorans DSM 12816 TaxID=1122930 RepID=A0A1W2C6A5_9FIRM|nr:replicative helicase loader/inhibitor [Papillibacter cinnamivorans]SMC80218.1 Loader and inhibitor of phage G40P [Papillibacter cinnamivorans DSM 12816]
MTRQETLRLLSELRAAYPSFCRGLGKAELERVVEFWQELFAGETYEDAHAAVLELVSEGTKGFVPSQGAILQRCRKISAASSSLSESRRTLLKNAAEIRKYYHSLGIPSPAEAKRRGISYSDWRRMAETAEGRSCEG